MADDLLPSQDAVVVGQHSCRVAIVQPSIPQYTVPFLKRLIAAAEAEGIRVDVFRGETPSAIRARGDAGDAPFVRPLRTREWTIRGRAFFYKSPATVRNGGYDLVILEHAIRNIESYELLARLGRRHIAFWGHGRTYTKDVSPLQEAVKHWLTQRATWFFGYTERGVDAVVEHGFPRDRTTVLNNTIDTVALRADLAAISDTEIAEFSRRHDLRGSTAIYLGGLDTYKRIPFLLDSAAIAHEKCSDFRLLIAGNGSDRPMVEKFVRENSWATFLGGVGGREKARALKAAQAVSIPGAIGLVALDSLVAGTPIVTTDYPHHGPEFDYLAGGTTAVVTPNDEHSYADGLVAFLADRPRQHEMSSRCQSEARMYTLDNVVSSFITGIKSALDHQQEGRRVVPLAANRYGSLIRTLLDFMPPTLARFVYRLRSSSIHFEGPYESWQEASARTAGYDADNILSRVLEATLKVKHGEAAFERDSVLFDEIDYPWPVTAGLMWAAARAAGRLDVLDFGGSLGSSYFQHARLLATLTDVRWNVVEQPNFTGTGRAELQDERLRFHDSIEDCLSESKPNVILISSVLQYLADPESVIAQIRAVRATVVIVDKTFVNTSPHHRIYTQHVPATIYRASYPCRSMSESALIDSFSPTYRLECAFDSTDAPPLVQIASLFRGFLFTNTGESGSDQ